MISVALLSMLNIFEMEDLWDQVPNLSLILQIYLVFFSQFDEVLCCTKEGMTRHYVAMLDIYAENHGLEFEGVYNIQECLENFNEMMVSYEFINAIRIGPKPDKFKFKPRVSRSFSSQCLEHITDSYYSGRNSRSRDCRR